MRTPAARIFELIDQQDADAFVACLSEDVVFRFGNADPAVGRDQVHAAVTGFFSVISGLRHHVRNVWDVDADTSICHIDVEYQRHDGETVYVPNVDILKWRGDLVCDWQIIIDIAPIFAPIDDETPLAVRSLAEQRA